MVLDSTFTDYQHSAQHVLNARDTGGWEPLRQMMETMPLRTCNATPGIQITLKISNAHFYFQTSE